MEQSNTEYYRLVLVLSLLRAEEIFFLPRELRHKIALLWRHASLEPSSRTKLIHTLEGLYEFLRSWAALAPILL